MRRETQHVLLLLLGGALLRISADTTYLRYVLPSHRWLLIAAGAVMVVLAAVGLVRDLRRPTARGHGEPAAWLLLLPVLVIALVPPPALGADRVARAGEGNTSVAAAVFPPLPAGDAPELGLSEVVQRAMFDTTGTLDGRAVTMTGFAVRRGTEVDLARLRISCCAADARVSRVRLAGDTGGPTADTWLRVVGVVAPGSATAATRWVPTVAVRSITPIGTPEDPYEH